MTLQEQVKPKIESLHKRLKEVRAEETLIVAQIQAWQEICEHPETKRVSSCGELWTKCLICEAEV